VIRTILVPIDGSPASHDALERSVEIAEALGARLLVLEVIEEFGPLPGKYDAAPEGVDRTEWLAAQRFDAVGDALSSDRVSWARLVEEGYPAEVICDLAEREKVDLIVMGHRGLSAVARFVIGSVSDKVVRNAPCSVMVVRGRR
jgi:nucleotide-binding universal stress UspA family protein